MCDYFLWGFLKDRIYKNAPETLAELKLAIETEIQAIESDMLERVFSNFEERLVACIDQDGGHLEHVI